MKNYIIFITLVYSFFHLGSASCAEKTAQITRIDTQSISQAEKLRNQALKENEAWMILESLTTEIGPRMAGSANDARAIAWAQAQFKRLGYDKVYTEPVIFPVWERKYEKAEILMPYPQPLKITALGGSIGTQGDLKAEIIAFPNLDALKQASKEQVVDKIVFIGNRMLRSKDGSGYGQAVAARRFGPMIAAKLGAKALLIRSIGTDSHRLPHTGMSAYLDDAKGDGAALKKHPQTKSGLYIVSTPIPAAALSNPDADLLSHMLERGKPVLINLNLDVGFNQQEYQSANVIGEITGKKHPEEVIIIGGHLDSWDLGTGAVDDGAGCAITMAAGALIKQQNLYPNRTIRVVLFSNEEQGLYGAKAYAKKHAHEIEKHIIGAESDFGADKIWRLDTQVKPEALYAINQIMQVLAPLGITRGMTMAEGGPDISRMGAAGMAVVDLYQDGTDYFDLHHTADDTLDKVKPENLRQNVAAYAAFAYLAAQATGDFGSASRKQ